MTVPIDSGLLMALEHGEMAAWGDFYRAASQASITACGLHLETSGEAMAAIASHADVLALNRATVLGLERPATAAEIDALLELYASAQVPRFFVQVPPSAAAAGLPRMLEERGFRNYNNWMKLHRDASPLPAATTDLTVERIDKLHAEDFGRLAAENFGWPNPLGRWVAETVGRPDWYHYLAFDDDEPVASGAFFVDGDTCWIDFATRLPDYRGRGAQSALLARRISDAAKLGCRRIIVETAEDTPEKPAPSFRNQLRFGFQVAYKRPNYVYEMR
jgi:GNAT superfamily N-acetyltransferase